MIGTCSKCGKLVDFCSEEEAYRPDRMCGACYSGAAKSVLAMDNERIAAAIVALYALTSKGDDWTNTDEVLQQAAFNLWEASDWDAERMAVYLWQHGLGEDFAMNFTNISRERFWAAVRTTRDGAAMTARCYVAGHIAPRSQPARMTVRGVAVEPTRTPIVRLVPCRWCGKFYGCDCLDWLEWMLLTTPQEESTNE